MRWLVFQDFIRVFEHNEKVFTNIAVVGGGPNDPEIDWLINQQPQIQIRYFGISEIEGQNFTYCDFNLPNKNSVSQKFDLVHCVQVFEHLWDIKQALINLSNLASDDGLIWINCPASCRAHGSPDYFSAGYQPQLIANLGNLLGLEVVEAYSIGSRRAYFYEHSLGRWPDQNEHDHPWLSMSGGHGGKIRSVLRWVKYFPDRVLASFFSGKILHSPDFSTQTVVVLRRSAGANRETIPD